VQRWLPRGMSNYSDRTAACDSHIVRWTEIRL